MQINTFSISGNLTADPLLKTVRTSNGDTPLATFRLAHDDGTKDRPHTSFFDIEVWGKRADIARRLFARGSRIVVEGKLRENRTEDGGKSTTRVVIRALQLHLVDFRSGAAAVSHNPDRPETRVEVIDAESDF